MKSESTCFILVLIIRGFCEFCVDNKGERMESKFLKTVGTVGKYRIIYCFFFGKPAEVGMCILYEKKSSCALGGIFVLLLLVLQTYV